MQVLHEARQDLFCIIIDPGASKANARAVKSSPGTPLELCFQVNVKAKNEVKLW